jgi:hypothetical protein
MVKNRINFEHLLVKIKIKFNVCVKRLMSDAINDYLKFHSCDRCNNTHELER